MLPKGLTRGELYFCRSVALRGVPIVAFQRAWPGRSSRYRAVTVARLTRKLMGNSDIQTGILHYRERLDGAGNRIKFRKRERDKERQDLELRLGIGLRQVATVVDRGTPETQDHNRTNIINKLCANGSLTEEMRMAAREIAALIEAKQRGYFASGGWAKTKIDYSGKGRDPLDAMSDDELDAIENRYKPWLDQVGITFIGPGKRRITIAQLVYDVVINNRGPRQIEKDYGMGHGTATEILKNALLRYAIIAGWARVGK